jgi:hypothetical protein
MVSPNAKRAEPDGANAVNATAASTPSATKTAPVLRARLQNPVTGAATGVS